MNPALIDQWFALNADQSSSSSSRRRSSRRMGSRRSCRNSSRRSSRRISSRSRSRGERGSTRTPPGPISMLCAEAGRLGTVKRPTATSPPAMMCLKMVSSKARAVTDLVCSRSTQAPTHQGRLLRLHRGGPADGVDHRRNDRGPGRYQPGPAYHRAAMNAARSPITRALPASRPPSPRLRCRTSSHRSRC